ncbi:alpha-D-ribose 1-methylphosphonate 5-phosphate C-P-lyase PhnJ [Dehalococcoidia bacterium]|nr:alpha-D-ribose 1-methylphosphonate 5-phosphate C-P-lyase PhnJ [Dehalococcoidia bacterium]MCL0087758.1 alpha-D-ribose 1-methylphosphonate 5-phosphate C-P-lyase PhnJ [Dehalococcoidia bacterium]
MQSRLEGYNFGLLDENTKREIRRNVLKAIAIPAYQVPFASRELPIFFGWGTGGLQITLSIIGPGDVMKVIDQGDDDSVNAVNLRRLIRCTTGVELTEDTKRATIIQTRHRVPEEKLRADQILCLQVPMPEPLRLVEPRETETRRMHGEKDYGRMYVKLYEDILHHKEITVGANYPVMVFDRYLMSPSPIPRWDIPRLNQAENLFLFGAGREKKIYAIPPYTDVTPLAFDDHPFRVEDFRGKACVLCGNVDAYLNELPGRDGQQTVYVCSDTSYCRKRRENDEEVRR